METRLSPRGKLIVFWVLAVLGLALLAHFASVLSPFLWAIITAYIFAPLIALVARRTRLPRPLVAVVFYLAIVAALVIGILTLVPILRQQADGLFRQLPQTTEAGIAYFEQQFPDLIARVGLNTQDLQRQINDVLNQITTRAPATALTLAQRIFHLVLELLVYLIATFFFFVQGDRLMAGLRASLPLRYQREGNRVLGEINATMGSYLRGQAILVVIMSSVTYVALSIFDMPYAFAIALATGCLELIPIIGPWSAGTIAVVVATFHPAPPFGWSHTVLAIAIGLTYLTLRQLEDILIIPTLIGRIVHLHPLLIIFVLLIGTSFGGALGLLLAVPLAAVVRILLLYLHGKIVAETERRIVAIDSHSELLLIRDELPELTNAHVVLLPRAGALRWEDLPTVQALAELRTRHGVNLSVVTPDVVAGSLFTAVGIETTVIHAAASEATARTTEHARPGEAIGGDQGHPPLQAIAQARR